MRHPDLQSWLSWQESLHSSEIDLGLDRVRQVATNMGIAPIWSIPVVTVAGTNGKGSSVAMLEALYHHAGYRTGSYTSPHLLQYNERIKIDRQTVPDDLICHAFDKIDKARLSADGGEISLTYFEFGTLAALSILHEADLDLVILEVGLGGRLDAVNIIDAAIALITPIALDHQSWLGDSREAIAGEKAGIIKAGSHVVYNDLEPAQAVLDKAKTTNVSLDLLADDFIAVAQADHLWQFKTGAVDINNLPRPSLEGDFQLNNAAAVIQVSQLLNDRLAISESAIKNALLDIRLAGRFQTICTHPDIIVDVAHNAHAVKALAVNLQQRPIKGRTLALVAMLEDKAICDALKQIDGQIDQYFLAGLQGSRTLSALQLQQRLQECISNDKLLINDSVSEAIEQVLSVATEDDRIIIFGSFITVSDAMQVLKRTKSGD